MAASSVQISLIYFTDITTDHVVCVTADPRGGAVQPADQHHLLRAVERQWGRRRRGCGVERKRTGLLCSHQTGLLLPTGPPT